MANAFKNAASRSIGTAAVKIGNYTTAAGAVATVIGLSLCNVSSSQCAVDVYMSDGTSNTWIVKGAPIYVGGTLVLFGGDQKLVLPPGYSLYVVSTVANSVDAIVSFLEVTP